jgi:2-polyprenyl-3-methyl-5-hydroxy-6-metoxy-1,4-benzoquinol methylase
MNGISHGKTLATDYADAIASSDYHQSRIGIAWRMLTQATDVGGLHAFDFGCGEGVFMRRLAERGAIVSGCDPDPLLVARAPSGTPLGGIEVLETQPPQSADILVVLNVLSFMTPAEVDRFWSAAERLVRAGGFMIQCNPNSIAAGSRYKWNTNPDQLKALQARHGFKETNTEFFQYYPLILGRGKRIHDPKQLAWLPRWLLRRRCTGFFSLSVRL